MTRIVCLMLLAYVLHASAVALIASGEPIQATPPPGGQMKTILCFGDSLTAGYGLDPAQAFPAMIQEKIYARGWDFRIVNAGLSGETTAGGLRRIDWVLQRPMAVLILALGANDSLRGLPITEARHNLQGIIDHTRQKYPQVKIVLAGMHAPPNLGREYTTSFHTMFSELATANNAALIPFLLEGVAGIPSLNLPDGLHPTPAGHQIIAENVWKVLEPVLQSLQEP
jgi:acyl-CoA thioesterase-1